MGGMSSGGPGGGPSAGDILQGNTGLPTPPGARAGFGPLGLKAGNSFSSYAPGGRPSNGRPAQLSAEFNPAGTEAAAFQAANPIANYGDPNGQMSAWGRHLQQQQIAQGINPNTPMQAPQYGTEGNVPPTYYGMSPEQTAAYRASNAPPGGYAPPMDAAAPAAMPMDPRLPFGIPGVPAPMQAGAPNPVLGRLGQQRPGGGRTGMGGRGGQKGGGRFQR
jgi:hypothetical protein